MVTKSGLHINNPIFVVSQAMLAVFEARSINPASRYALILVDRQFGDEFREAHRRGRDVDGFFAPSRLYPPNDTSTQY